MVQAELFPEIRFRLDQQQRRQLAGLLKFEDRPPGFTLARWAVLTLGAASQVGELELAILSDELGYSVGSELR